VGLLILFFVFSGWIPSPIGFLGIYLFCRTLEPIAITPFQKRVADGGVHSIVLGGEHIVHSLKRISYWFKYRIGLMG